jgi:chaperonin cofactor prefoldin
MYDEKNKAQIEKDLRPIREATSELIDLYNQYKTVGQWEIVKDIDARIKEARDNLETLENRYKSTPVAERENFLSDMRQITSKIKETSSFVEKGIKSAKDRIASQEARERLNSYASQEARERLNSYRR